MSFHSEPKNFLALLIPMCASSLREQGNPECSPATSVKQPPLPQPSELLLGDLADDTTPGSPSTSACLGNSIPQLGEC